MAASAVAAVAVWPPSNAAQRLRPRRAAGLSRAGTPLLLPLSLSSRGELSEGGGSPFGLFSLLPPLPLLLLLLPPLAVEGRVGTGAQRLPRSFSDGEAPVVTAAVVAGERAGLLPLSLQLSPSRWSALLWLPPWKGSVMVARPPVMAGG